LGKNLIPQIPPNGKWLSHKFEKSETGNFRKQKEFSPKIKFGGYGSNVIKQELSKVTVKPVKYIVPEICSRDTETGKFASKYKGIYRCMFIGEEKDKFHFAIYF